jgi:RNA polymerase sigma factor (sigma-70 family)
MELGEHLFRQEAGRIVAALTRTFGLHNVALAEDVTQDAFCRALETWKQRGVPDNPSAWLMKAAKNRAVDVLRRERTARNFAPDLGRLLHSEWTMAYAVETLLDPTEIADDQLRMMFSCCDPRLPETTQVMLVLQLAGGFGAREIAAAFVSKSAAVEKRLARAKRFLAESGTLFDIADAADFERRLPLVERALYLIFNEGYHGASPQGAVRTELCGEAIRLATLLAEHPLGSHPSTLALCALFCFGAARLPARLDAQGELQSEQQRDRWDRQLIARGRQWLEGAAGGSRLTAYHIEAAIAYEHCTAPSAERTDWNAVVALYDRLMDVAPSPIVELNRAIALGHARGPQHALQAIEAIAERNRLADYPFYHAALGDFQFRCDNRSAARDAFSAALACARSPMERRFFKRRLSACG